MKIILISSFYKPSVGGVERQVEEIYLHLKSRGINVKVYTTDASHSGEKRLETVEINSDIKRFKYWFGFGYFFRFAPGLIFDLLFADFDIIHVHNSHDAHILPVIFLKLLRGKKLVVTGHNPYVVDNSKRKAMLSSAVKFFDFFLKVFSFGINKYIALLNSEKNYVQDYLNIKSSKISVIPNGIRDDYFEQVKSLDENNLFIKEFNLDKKDYKLVLGCLCRVDYVKGIQNLLVSVKHNPDCLFIISGGDGGYLQTLKEMFKGYSNILFTERYINIEESLEFYAFIDVFLLPSVYEPFGITLVEAMTQGKYILASSHGGPKEIINNEFGKILDPNNQEEWSITISEIKEHKNEIIEKGKNAISVSKYYQWNSVIDNLIEVYKDTLLK